jgi:hypothetical protein
LVEIYALFQSSSSYDMRSMAMVEELEDLAEDQRSTKEAAVAVG